ncbi:tRNA (N6-threonylcarbamoyladenosine(37)-N6)-methyltransferase TrmO [Apibacter raozihei]|uniref:tRNA (N6-threonylcarbamoyladenosine(37)-N6)-methyltransferase TrmO n=1 Tax=Apibacter raozihei TaxID=2500547 RepID=UPI000FE2CEE2|nr:tRNA (N6-threonylcarbamoyladenosine(37)-N6)-methyltransferase TrmO [Apibacter raozihei]
MKNILLESLGVINTPHKKIEGMPIQPAGAVGIQGTIIVDEKFLKGLKDLEGFSHFILIYLFHQIQEYELEIIPFMDTVARGVFATRSPKRPNRIGLSIVKMIKIENNRVYFEGADMLDGTPLLDIKPFFGNYDNQFNVKNGWLDKVGKIDISKKKSDKRFE